MIELKTEFLGTRVTPTEAKRVDEYLEMAGLRMGELVRQSVAEFITNHPVKAIV